MEKVNCFIRKNTPELRKRIEDLGVKLCPCVTFHHAIWLDFILEADEDNTVHGAPMYDEDNMERNISCYLEMVQEEGYIDCDDNEEMFLALIALRDDTDKNQWFVHKSKSHWWNCSLDSFQKDYMESNEDNELKFKDWHKATAQEIVEHFKTK